MNYQICKRCGKMFKKNGNIYCEECNHIAEKEQDLILGYIKMHPEATILDIITETKVTLKSINNLVEEGYVAYVDNKDKGIDGDKLLRAMDTIVDRKGKFHIKKIR